MIRLPDRTRSRAFLFGTATYVDPEFANLPAVENNLNDLHAVLTSPLGAFAPDRCSVRLNPRDPTTVYNELQQHAVDAEDTLLVYFAGHGKPGLSGELYLALPGTSQTNLRVSGFQYDLVREIIAACGNAANTIVIIDCCFSGRAVQGMSGGTAVMVDQLEIEGSAVLTATTATTTALAPPGARHTGFTGTLLSVLRSGVPGAGDMLSLGTIAEQVRQRAHAGGLPVPQHRFGGMTHRLALVRNAAASGTAVKVSPPPSSPTPRISVRQTYVARPLPLAGTLHATKLDLAATIRRRWSIAADRFFSQMGTAEAPSEAWAELLAWLRQFNDPRTDDVEGRITLVDRFLTNRSLSPDQKLLHLLRWLDPDGPVFYRGHRITYHTLARACLGKHAKTGNSEAWLYKELLSQKLLGTFASFGTLGQLRGTQRRWDNARVAWQTATTRASLPSGVRTWATATGPGALLAELLPPSAVAEALRELPDGVRQPNPPVAWYDELLKAAGGEETLLGRLIAADLSKRARQEGLQQQRKRPRQQDLKPKALRSNVASEQRQRQADEKEERRRPENRQREQEQRHRAEGEVKPQKHEEQQLKRDGNQRAVKRKRTRPADRTAAIFRALVLGAAWALGATVIVWLSWLVFSFEFDVAILLTYLSTVLGGAPMLGLVPSAFRLGSIYRPRLSVPSSWLPPTRTIIIQSGLMLLFGSIAAASSRRESDLTPYADLHEKVTLEGFRFRADSDLLREVGMKQFLWYVDRAGEYRSGGWSVLFGLVVSLAFVSIFLVGLEAGHRMASAVTGNVGRFQAAALAGV